MWKVVELDGLSGEWKEHGTFRDVAECKAQVKSFAAGAKNVFAFPDGKLPENKEEQQKLAEEVFAANGGRVERATVGLELGTPKKGDPAPFNCPGRCFCVIAHGRRRCETYWCSGNGWCWWVSCGMSC